MRLMRTILDAAVSSSAKVGSNERKIGDFYSSCMDTTAIDRLIETRFGLGPLGARDAASPDMSQAFDFGQ